MEWETVIGLEVHAQLSTASKMFSAASTYSGAPPNSNACEVDIAFPGVLPVANKGAVERAIRFGLAVGGSINRRSVFARKNYFYPDLPKGYQISQLELPIVKGGTVSIVVKGGEKSIRLTRAHLEEDAGKSLHEDFHGLSGVDLNRAGTPLLEIVSEPDMRSPAEAVAYARMVHALVRWFHICDGNMQEGSFRCDANVSVRPAGSLDHGKRAEIKNVNSFRFLERAIEYEVKRQIGIIEDGGRVVQETRLYDPDKNETRLMRSKEEANDYRYFPDPDLLPLVVSSEWIEEIRADMYELPHERKQRYMNSYGLSENDALVLNSDFDLGNYFEGVARVQSLRSGERRANADFKLCANWVINKVAAERNRDRENAARQGWDEPQSWQFGVSDNTAGHLFRRFREGVINANIRDELFSEFWAEARDSGHSHQGGYPERVDELIESRGLRQLNDVGAIERLIDEVLAANPKSVEEYRAGKEKAFNALVGQTMKATKGKGNPAQVNEILRRKLGG